MTIAWTDEEIEKYGREVAEYCSLGVRWCTITQRYRQAFPDISEAELRRLLCLYRAKINAKYEDRRC